MIQTFVAHPLGQCPGISGQSGNSDGDVVIDFEAFLLVGG
jgi:hypothetical protein